MSDYITTTTALDLTVRTENFMRDMVDSLAARMRDERGQTAAEYLGVLVVVSVIIAAVSQTTVGDDIKGWITETIRKISTGDEATT